MFERVVRCKRVRADSNTGLLIPSTLKIKQEGPVTLLKIYCLQKFSINFS